MSATRWTTTCQGCRREREVESRSSHAMKVLCDECAERPHRPPSASGLKGDAAQPTTQAPTDRAAWVSGVLGLGMDPIIGVTRESAHLDAPINVRLRSGRVLRWERQRDLMKADDLVAPILFTPGLGGPAKPLNKAAAMAVVNALMELVETCEEHDHLAEAREWMEGFERDRPVLERAMDTADAAQATMLELRGFVPLPGDHGRTLAAWEIAPIVLDTVTGRRYARTLDVGDYVRQGRRVVVSWPALNARLAEIGWKRVERQLWTPRNAPREHARKVTVRVYVGQPEPS